MTFRLFDYYKTVPILTGASGGEEGASEDTTMVPRVANSLMKSVKLIPGEAMIIFAFVRVFMEGREHEMLYEHFATIAALLSTIIIRLFAVPGVFRPQPVALILSLLSCGLWVLSQGGFVIVQAPSDVRPFFLLVLMFTVFIGAWIVPGERRVL